MNTLNLLDQRIASAFYGDFSNLRPAQEAAIEPLVSGKNLVLSSGTGSGKTEAVMAPLVSRYWRQAIRSDALTILYIAPTKALVNDLEKRLSLVLQKIGLRVGIRHGDRDDLQSGFKPHVLITTPESLDVLLFRKDAALDNIQSIVIDEVHLLYNTQRGLQLSVLIQRLKQKIEHPLQWAALSATVGRLSDVRNFLFGTEEAEFLEFSAHRAIKAHIRHINNEADFIKCIKQLTQGYPATKLLVFCNARRECERLADILQQQKSLRLKVFTHYSSLSAEVRVEIEHKFSQAKSHAVCISTSTLELGIDIGNINAVILWDVPSGAESFLQRIGRSNRRENQTNVICLVTDQTSNYIEDTLSFLALIDTAQKGQLPLRSPYELYGAVGQQCLSMIASDKGRFTRVADLYKLFDHQKYLDRPKLEAILDELSNKEYLQKHGFKNQYGAADNLYRLEDYRLIYGNFGIGSRQVEVCYGSKSLGEVPVDNIFKIRSGTLVRFAGQIWEVRKVSTQAILVEPTQSKGKTVDFSYSGKGLGTDSFIYNQVWHLIYGEDIQVDVLSKSLNQQINIWLDRIRQSCRVNEIPFTQSTEGIRYYTFGGYLVNKAIGLLTQQSVFQASPISLVARSRIDWASIPANSQAYQPLFDLLFESSDHSIYQDLLPAELQVHEFMQAWLKDATVNGVLNRLANSTAVQVSSFWSI
ncbi:MAG: hypothetical protein Kow00121_06290 [Elainellaceae cyanobacterium]